jgi:hypothetical protein
MGNPMLLAAAKPLIDAKKALLKRTMSIAGIDDDLEQYLPQPVQPLVPGALPMLPPGAVAPDGSDPNSGGGAGLPGPPYLQVPVWTAPLPRRDLLARNSPQGTI